MTTVRDDELDGPGSPGPRVGDGPVVRVIAYLLLFVFGALQALIGTFQFSRGPAWSLVAVCFALAILVTCVLGAWGMHAAAGAIISFAKWTGSRARRRAGS